jgi:hypothetical protein
MLFETLARHASGLHARHAVEEEGGDWEFSAGMVRFNRVATAQAVARHLLRRPREAGEPFPLVVCYHRRHLLVDRFAIERFLDEVLNRKATQLPRARRVRAAMEKHRSVCLVVCTTSIEETGRDHDFDWAILEPSSVRSAIQASGRVRRHRDALMAANPNVLLMSTTLRAALQPEAPRPYGRAGLQDDALLAQTDRFFVEHVDGAVARALESMGIHAAAAQRGRLTARRLMLDIDDLMPMASWSEGLNPSDALLPPERFEQSRLLALAYLSQSARLGELAPVGALFENVSGAASRAGLRMRSLPGYFRPAAPLCANHARATEFRRSATELPETTIRMDDAGRFQVLDGFRSLYEVPAAPAVPVIDEEREPVGLLAQDARERASVLASALGLGPTGEWRLREGQLLGAPPDPLRGAVGYNPVLGLARAGST